MISDLNGSLGSRQFLNIANEETCFASCACKFKSTGCSLVWKALLIKKLLMFLNGLLVLVEPNFRNREKKCQKKNWMLFGRDFCTSAGNRDGTLSVLQKFINEIHLRAAIDRFLRSLPLNKPFSTISDPAFTEANKALEHLQKSSEKQATLPA